MGPRPGREPTVFPRKTQRYAVQIPAYFTGEHMTGEGTIVNLSPEGCAILSKENPRVSSYLSVRIDLSERDAPLLIDLAAVRWSSDEQIGLEFIRMGESEQERLRRFVKTLEVEPQR